MGQRGAIDILIAAVGLALGSRAQTKAQVPGLRALASCKLPVFLGPVWSWPGTRWPSERSGAPARQAELQH